MAKVVKSVKRAKSKRVKSKRQVKRASSAKTSPIVTNDGKLVGKVTHYYGKIGVAVVAVNSIMRKGDKIKIGKTDFFNQSVRSMQLNKERIDVARKGKEIGMRVYKKARTGDRVFKV